MLKKFAHKTPEGMMKLLTTPNAFMELITNVLIPELKKEENHKHTVEVLLQICSGLAITHPGKTSHADDIVSGAFLTLINHQMTIIRTVDIPLDFKGIVFDVGNTEFDHHQKPREVRPDGTFYAALGKLWRFLGHLFFSDFVVEYMDENFCSKLDDTDNTGKENMLSQALGSFNPVWSANSNGDAEYTRALLVAQTILVNYLHMAIAEETAAIEVEKAVATSSHSSPYVLELPEYFPWKYTLSKHPEWEYKVVIYPSTRDTGYEVQRIPNTGFEFPQDWWGSITDAYKPVKGIRFCHDSGFLAAFETREDAVNTVYSVLGN